MSESLHSRGAWATTALLVFSLGCRDDLVSDKPLLCPDPALYSEAVQPYVEKRCGTLDCHGSTQRPLRIYGQFGLRHPVETHVSGGEPTTPAELDANYLSFCGLEPERMAEALDDLGASADRLKIVAKARGLMNHKGGRVVEEGDPGDRCLSGWVGKISTEDAARVRAECKAALEILK
jgi:hypothetical protein